MHLISWWSGPYPSFQWGWVRHGWLGDAAHLGWGRGCGFVKKMKAIEHKCQNELYDHISWFKAIKIQLNWKITRFPWRKIIVMVTESTWINTTHRYLELHLDADICKMQNYHPSRSADPKRVRTHVALIRRHGKSRFVDLVVVCFLPQNNYENRSSWKWKLQAPAQNVQQQTGRSSEKPTNIRRLLFRSHGRCWRYILWVITFLPM